MDVFVFLFDVGVKVSVFNSVIGFIVLYEVVVFGNWDIVEYLFKDKKVDVNFLDYKVMILFMYVSGFGYDIICEYLL